MIYIVSKRLIIQNKNSPSFSWKLDNSIYLVQHNVFSIHRNTDWEGTREIERNLQTLTEIEIFWETFIWYHICLSPSSGHCRHSRVLFCSYPQFWTKSHKNHPKMKISQKSLVVITDHSVFTFVKAAKILDFIHLKSKPITYLFPRQPSHILRKIRPNNSLPLEQLSFYGVVRVLTARRRGEAELT